MSKKPKRNDFFFTEYLAVQELFPIFALTKAITYIYLLTNKTEMIMNKIKVSYLVRLWVLRSSTVYAALLPRILARKNVSFFVVVG